ncbi:MAG: heavy metal sensor histidine kinase [Acidobacteria bacterium]|nr:heavy metal sensor histidine kinase [Acidobacteriota bacterium]
MPKRRASLATRLAIAYGLLALLLMGASSAFLYRALAHAAWRDDAEDVTHASRVVAQRMAEGGAPGANALDVEAGVLVRVSAADGHAALESPGMPSLPSAASAPRRPTRVTAPDGSHWIAATAPWPGGTVLAVKDMSHHARLLDSYQDTLLANALLLALLSALAGWLIARRGLAPLDRLAQATAGIQPSTLSTRLDPASAPAELERLATALNLTLARLEAAFSRLAELSADMAHELRTPLHGLRLELESLSAHTPPELRDRIGAATESVDHMGALVEQMLFLARAEDPSTAIAAQDLDLGTALKDAARPFELLAEEQGVPLRVDAPDGCMIHADPTLLRRAIHNLLGNALRHTASGEVALSGHRVDGAVLITVADTGEGIPSDQLPRLGQRFARTDLSRSRATGGTGLGLAIVASILRLHGGELSLESREGEGTRARMRFPDT